MTTCLYLDGLKFDILVQCFQCHLQYVATAGWWAKTPQTILQIPKLKY